MLGRQSWLYSAEGLSSVPSTHNGRINYIWLLELWHVLFVIFFPLLSSPRSPRKAALCVVTGLRGGAGVERGGAGTGALKCPA